MPEKPVTVSVIVPMYNAAAYITDTLKAVLSQNVALEVILVNDGSSDNTLEICQNMNDSRINIIDKKNTGVSDSRNTGLSQASGKYICFFDADDLMAPSFLSSRVGFLENNPGYIGACGKVIKKFQDTNQLDSRTFNGISADPLKDILFFNPDTITCPSNFVFNREWLECTQVFFNTNLSSSADRFFLLELSAWGVLHEVTDPGSELIYLVRTNSMSHMLTNELLEDNLKFRNEVIEKIPLIRSRKKRLLSK